MSTSSAQRIAGSFLRASFDSTGLEDYASMEPEDWAEMGMWMFGLDPRSIFECKREGILAVI